MGLEDFSPPSTLNIKNYLSLPPTKYGILSLTAYLLLSLPRSVEPGLCLITIVISKLSHSLLPLHALALPLLFLCLPTQPVNLLLCLSLLTWNFKLVSFQIRLVWELQALHLADSGLSFLSSPWQTPAFTASIANSIPGNF